MDPTDTVVHTVCTSSCNKRENVIHIQEKQPQFFAKESFIQSAVRSQSCIVKVRITNAQAAVVHVPQIRAHIARRNLHIYVLY